MGVGEEVWSVPPLLALFPLFASLPFLFFNCVRGDGTPQQVFGYQVVDDSNNPQGNQSPSSEEGRGESGERRSSASDSRSSRRRRSKRASKRASVNRGTEREKDGEPERDPMSRARFGAPGTVDPVYEEVDVYEGGGSEGKVGASVRRRSMAHPSNRFQIPTLREAKMDTKLGKNQKREEPPDETQRSKRAGPSIASNLALNQPLKKREELTSTTRDQTELDKGAETRTLKSMTVMSQMESKKEEISLHPAITQKSADALGTADERRNTQYVGKYVNKVSSMSPIVAKQGMREATLLGPTKPQSIDAKKRRGGEVKSLAQEKNPRVYGTREEKSQ